MGGVDITKTFLDLPLHILEAVTMAPNRGETPDKQQTEDDYPSSDNDSFKSFEPDSPVSTRDNETAKQPNSPETAAIKPAEENAQDIKSSLPSTTNQTPRPQPSQPSEPGTRFPPAEEASLLSSSNETKTAANTLFGNGSYENALQTYDRALSLCPNYLDYELAVLHSNISACNLKLADWKAAAEAAGKGIENSERLEPLPVVRAAEKEKVGGAGGGKKDGTAAGPGSKVEDDGQVEEVDEALTERLENLSRSGRSLAEVRKLQVKMLMRRAKAKSELGGWANLQAADEDYRVLLAPVMLPTLSPTDKRSVETNARALGPRLNQAKEQEMAEMMGKLKGLGNTFLKPFGLSTENFKFEQDAKTGGYSMNFDQNAGKN